jgi:tetratricopeptide (TPR) repeat protein
LFKAGVERAKWRQEREIRSSVLARVTASLLLRFAKAAARDSHYATAEVFYQAIILLKPRSFVWRQTGNMLAGQGLFRAAIDCFDRAIALDDNDAAAWHAKAIAWRRLDDAEESRKAMKQAIALLPSLGEGSTKAMK